MLKEKVDMPERELEEQEQQELELKAAAEAAEMQKADNAKVSTLHLEFTSPSLYVQFFSLKH